MQKYTVGLWVRADFAQRAQPLPVSVDELRLRDASVHNGAVTRTAIETTLLPTNDSCLLLTNISEPCGSTGITGDLSGCRRSFEQRAMRNGHQSG